MEKSQCVKMISLSILFVTLSVALTGATTNYHSFSHVKNVKSHSDAFETFRLPNNTKPETYDINLRTWIHQANMSFTGTVRIGIIALESTNSITLHHRALSIENVTVLSDDEDPISIGVVLYDSVFEFLTIPIATSNLTEGSRYFVEIQFSGTMLTFWNGFYAQSYWNEEAEDNVYLASTQFEATDARRAFPCYDEPALKAQFTIRLTHDPSLLAKSNMRTISDAPVQK